MFSNRWWMVGSALVVLVALGLVTTGSALAQNPPSAVRDKFRSGDNVLIAANETVAHDLYVSGATVRVDGRIDGDLFVAGSTVDVSGPVNGDLYVGAGTVTVSGPVSGDVFVAGGTVMVSGSVGRHLRAAGGNISVSNNVQLDLMVGGGTLALRRDARVGGDFIFSTGQTSLDGSVAGSVLGATSDYSKSGTVAGVEDVTVNAPEPAQEPDREVGDWLLGQLQRYIGIVLVGALLLLLTPGLLRSAAARLRARPLPSAGFGLLGVIAFVPVLLALVIVMVLVAIALGMLGLGRVVLAVVFGVLLGSAALSFAFLVVALFLAAIVVGLTVGQLGLERSAAEFRGRDYAALALGVLAIVAATALPYAGWLVQLVVLCLGLGALLLALWRRRRGTEPLPERPPAPAL